MKSILPNNHPLITINHFLLIYFNINLIPAFTYYWGATSLLLQATSNSQNFILNYFYINAMSNISNF